MVVRSGTGMPFALAVAAVDNHEELVIRPASPLVMASGVYAGMTLPDGLAAALADCDNHVRFNPAQFPIRQKQEVA